jgi:hypothetical protein
VTNTNGQRAADRARPRSACPSDGAEREAGVDQVRADYVHSPTPQCPSETSAQRLTIDRDASALGREHTGFSERLHPRPDHFHQLVQINVRERTQHHVVRGHASRQGDELAEPRFMVPQTLDDDLRVVGAREDGDERAEQGFREDVHTTLVTSGIAQT